MATVECPHPIPQLIKEHIMPRESAIPAEEMVKSRFLAYRSNRYGPNKVEELVGLELSPSGQWIRLMDQHGHKFWQEVKDVVVVEILHTRSPASPPPDSPHR